MQDFWGPGACLVLLLGSLHNLLRGALQKKRAPSKGPYHQGPKDLEATLYRADLGPGLVEEVLKHLKEQKGPRRARAREFLLSLMNLPPQDKPRSEGLQVIMVVGMNGVGKTTTIGKMAIRLVGLGPKVVVGAADTFRPGAVQQLETWCRRARATMVGPQKEGGPPSAVIFEAIKRAQKMGADYCLLDTAGRSHTQENLMKELVKMKAVACKAQGRAVHQVWSVLDSTTGQNALAQAREFHRHLGVTGLILTKCDGSSRGGVGVSIVRELKVPVVFLGVGEGPGDLKPFDLNEYLDALLGIR